MLTMVKRINVLQHKSATAKENFETREWERCDSALGRRIAVDTKIICTALCLVVGLHSLSRLGRGTNAHAASEKGCPNAAFVRISDHNSLPADAALSRFFYVSPHGRDSAAGNSRDHAWRTVGHAARAMNPGDTVVVEAGT